MPFQICENNPRLPLRWWSAEIVCLCLSGAVSQFPHFVLKHLTPETYMQHAGGALEPDDLGSGHVLLEQII